MNKEEKICNQCFKEMKIHFGEATYKVCANPKCPNYALLQIPLEDMPK